jgi:phosphatidate cytidylyltransferase
MSICGVPFRISKAASADSERCEDVKARVLTALAGIPVILILLAAGGPAWAMFLALLVVISGSELGRLYARLGYRHTGLWIAVGGLVLLAVAYTSGGDGKVWLSWPLAVAALTTLALTRELFSSEHLPLGRAAAICMGSLYVGLFAFLYLARTDGIATALLAVLGTWSADTLAFMIGRAIGRRPLAPTISPKKTCEGALAGLVGGLATGVIVGVIAQWPMWQGPVLGAGVALAAQIGDLVESAMKREAGVKDSGSLLPGHGGVLDRFDSLIFAGVAVYYLRLLF